MSAGTTTDEARAGQRPLLFFRTQPHLSAGATGTLAGCLFRHLQHRAGASAFQP